MAKQKKPEKCPAFVAKSGRSMLPYTVRLTATEVWATLIERLNDCRSLLYIYGVLSEAENVKVHRRLLKRNKKFNK